MIPSRILVVEDDRIVARDIQQQLSRIGHVVVGITARGEDVMALAVQSQPDLVLMDVRLEGKLDGIDVAQQIHEAFRVPVIFLTAYADEETTRRARVTEPFGYLLKPFEDSQLRTTIEMALYKHAADRKLRQSERRYAVTLSSIGDAVIATDELLLVTYMNPVAELLTGWPVSEAIGRPLIEIFRIINEDTRQTVDNPAVKVLRTGVVVGLANHTMLVARDGREFPIDDCGSPIVDDGGAITGTVLVFRDISDRRQIDAALRNAQSELATVGQRLMLGELAATIAHEVTQPMSGVSLNCDAVLRMLEADIPDLEKVRSAIQRVDRDARRAVEICARIRDLFSRAGSTALAPVDLNDAIQEVVHLKRNEIRSAGVTLRMELGDDLPRPVGDRVQLQQVIVNLITNAIQAMSGAESTHGELLIRTEKTGDAEVQALFQDTGVGIEPSKIDQIFGAFYTTKVDGMGMGLWISRSIIEKHRGRLWAIVNTGPGLTIALTLPCRSSAAFVPST
jgi:PAS domain S-box-containing protein